MASTHVNHNIYITDVKTGKCLHSLVGHRRTPWCLTFHPTIPGLVASGCLDGEVRIWDLHVCKNECFEVLLSWALYSALCIFTTKFCGKKNLNMHTEKGWLREGSLDSGFVLFFKSRTEIQISAPKLYSFSCQSFGVNVCCVLLCRVVVRAGSQKGT